MPTGARLLLLAAVLGNVWLLWTFYDQHWYVVDEGNYAHVAERLLAGDVLHRDVQDLHPGYINFLNAAAFAVFGIDLVSLRYPLVFISLAQALLIACLFVRRSVLLAAAASVAMTALGVIQFLNPTAHWYCLFLTVTLVGWLTWVPPTHGTRTFGAGVLLGAITLFRQLSGVWVAMALLVILLREQSTGARGRDAVLGRGVVLLMLVSLLAYLAFAGGPEASSILLIASWPLTILFFSLRDVSTTNRASVRILWQLSSGGMVAALPLLLYHVVHGSLLAWLDDTVFASMVLTTIPFFENAWFLVLPMSGLVHVADPDDLTAFANGLYWAALPLIPIANGILTIRWMWSARSDVPVLPLLSAFYSLVTLHLAGAVYLSYTVGLATAAVLWFATCGPRKRIPYFAAATAWMSVMAVVFHAGQSSFRKPIDAARGQRTVTAETPRCPPLARSTLRIESRECEPYRRMVRIIEAEAPADSSIFAVPSDAELYFLTARPNPFRFYNSALGVHTSQDLEAVLDVLTNRPPRVVTYRPDDKYNTEASRRIMEYVHTRYDRFDTIAGVELYRPRNIPKQEAE
jgi:hypothetical protein